MADIPSVASWNILVSNSTSNIKAGLKGLVGRGADVICLQEVSDDTKHNMIESYLSSLGFQDVNNDNAVPIYVRKSTWTVVNQGAIKAQDGPITVENGTGGTTFGDKWINWVRIKNKKTNKDAYVANTHMYPGVDGGGGKFKTNAPKRIAAYRHHLSELTFLIGGHKNTGLPCFVTGDFNLAYAASTELMNAMRGRGFVANWQTLGAKPTHTTRCIDYVFSANTKAVYQAVTGKYGSDHSGVFVRHSTNASTPAKAPVQAKPVNFEGMIGSVDLSGINNGVTAQNHIGNIYVMGSKIRANIANQITNAKVSGAFGQVTQLTIEMVDPQYKVLHQGMFALGTPVRYQDLSFVVASIATKAIAGNAGLEIVCRPKTVSDLKRRRGALVYKNASPSQFVIAECAKVGARYNVQASASRTQVARDVPTKGERYDEASRPSSWTTFQRLASELGYICFEVSGVIHFGKPSYFMKNGRSNAMKVNYDYTNAHIGGGNVSIDTEDVPQCVRSEDSTEGVTVSVVLPPERTPQARVGRALYLTGVWGFTNYYLINSIDFSISGKTERLTVNASSAIDPVPAGEAGESGGSTGGGSTGGGSNNSTSGGSTSVKAAKAGTYGGRKISSTMMANALLIYKSAIKNGVGTRGATAGIMTGLVEAGLINVNFGDRDSLGIFQQRASWGSARSRMNVTESADRFYKRMKQISGYKTMSLGTLCQRIQVSAFPSRYAQQEKTAKAIVAAISRTATSGGGGAKLPSGSSNSKRATDMVTWALSRVGISRYVFGATRNTSNADLRVFDCSSLIRWACARVGVYMPYNTRTQEPYLKGSKGTAISKSRAMQIRGAVFYQTNVHCGISLGNGKTVEAANPRAGIKIASASFTGYRNAYLINDLRY